MKYLLLLLFCLCTSTDKTPKQDNLVLTEFLRHPAVQTVISSYDALIVSNSEYCIESCQVLISELSKMVEVKVFDKEDMWLRRVHSFVEVIEYNRTSIHFYLYDNGYKREIQIN